MTQRKPETAKQLQRRRERDAAHRERERESIRRGEDPAIGQAWTLREDNIISKTDFPPVRIIGRDNGEGNVSNLGRWLVVDAWGTKMSIWDDDIERYRRVPVSTFYSVESFHRKQKRHGRAA